MSVEKTTFRWNGGEVSGALHHADGGTDYLVLGHGAGAPMHAPKLVTYADYLASRGIGVVRFNFPYTEAGRKAPDRQPVLEECYTAVAQAVASRAKRLFLGGRSMGGRIGTHVAANGFHCDGLVLLSYPLHPPGKPEKLRTAHLPDINAPMLFVQGSRDTFATPALLHDTIESLPTATLYVVKGADHGHSVRGRTMEDVARELVEATTSWIARISP
ncbi:MAG TPA: alpha/beta family hydrolase [Actinomycetota bacterium]|nr:alpha/beta family hydrolase [Actinomycetota bacterium]